MRFRMELTLASFAMLAVPFAVCAQQQPQSQNPMPGMKMPQEQHEHMQMPAAPALQFPQFGRAQQKAGGNLFTLEQAQHLAMNANPTLRQADAEIRAAKARKQQAGLYPNPTVGYSGDELRGGSRGGGKQGFFVEQTIVTGGKLGKSKDVFSKEEQLAELEAEEQRTRVETAVKLAFYRVLAAQELSDARWDLARVADESIETQRRLGMTGQTDDMEMLGYEIEAQRLRLAARMQENTLREEWRSLAAVIGKPDLPIETVAGDLEHGWPELNEEQIIETIASDSPAAKIAAISVGRAQSALLRAKRESLPDIILRGGLDYNNEQLDFGGRPVGWEGSAEVGVALPIFNRNQGNVAAAVAEGDRATQEKTRIALTLRERAASAVDEYSNARLGAQTYRDEILPRAKKAYTLMSEKYGEMLASRPNVLLRKRALFELQVEYIVALEQVWNAGLTLQGFLLTDGLEAPSSPVNMDRPIRETNVPMPERQTAPN